MSRMYWTQYVWNIKSLHLFQGIPPDYMTCEININEIPKLQRPKKNYINTLYIKQRTW